MVALAIQTIGGIGMACCKLCIPCLRRIGIRLADPLPTFVACIPFATTVATGSGFRKLIRCPAGRHLGTDNRTSNSEEYADASSAVISTMSSYGRPAAATGFRKLRCESYTKHRHLGTAIRTSNSEEYAGASSAVIRTSYGHPTAATGFRTLRCAAGRHLGTEIQSNCPRSSSDGSTVRAIIETYIYGCAAAATGFRKLRCESYTKHRHLGTGIRTSSSACSAVISTTAFDFCIAAITTSGFRSGIAVITAAWLLEMPLEAKRVCLVQLDCGLERLPHPESGCGRVPIYAALR